MTDLHEGLGTFYDETKGTVLTSLQQMSFTYRTLVIHLSNGHPPLKKKIKTLLLFFEYQHKVLSFNLQKVSQIFRSLYLLLIFSEFYSKTCKTENSLKKSDIEINIYPMR